MKVLVIQLARFGDIYQTWPCLNALKRERPEAEIHLLVRETFKEATEGLTSVSRVLSLNTQDLLAPVLVEKNQTEASVEKAEKFLATLRQEAYDVIVNLSYSRTSAFIVKAVKSNKAICMGYDMHSSGALFPADDVAAYFMANVGVGKANRIHLTDLFAMQMGVNLNLEDFAAPTKFIEKTKFAIERNSVAIHIGASQSFKTLSPEKWSMIIRELGVRGIEQVVLIGSKAEILVSQKITNSVSQVKVLNLVGQGALLNVFAVLRDVQALICGDSAIMQMASLCGVKTLNLSAEGVSYKETGPRAPSSIVLPYKNQEEVSAAIVARKCAALVGGIVQADEIQTVWSIPSYVNISETPSEKFRWELVAALYFEGAYPLIENVNTYQAFAQFRAINEMQIQQLNMIRQRKDLAQVEVNRNLLAKMDQTCEILCQKAIEVQPLWDWIKIERTRLDSHDHQVLAMGQLEIHKKIEKVLRLYSLENEQELVGG